MNRSRIPFTLLVFIMVVILSFTGNAKISYAQDARDIVFEYLTGTVELTPAAACGIMANIDKESSFNSDIWGGGGSYGFCQWLGVRRVNLVNYCASIGLGSNTAEGQVRFIYHELQTSYTDVLQYLRNVGNSADAAYNAAYYFCLQYERPANKYTMSSIRGNHAKNEFWPVYGASACYLRSSDSENGVELIWNGSKEKEYLIYRSKEKDGTFKLIGCKGSGAANSFTDRKAKSQTTYYYVVAVKPSDSNGADQFTGIKNCTGKHSNVVSASRRGYVSDKECKIKVTPDTVSYTGSEIQPAVEVSYNGQLLQEGTDYKIVYQNNINVGNASIIITGRGVYRGEKTVTFRIERAKQTISAPNREYVFQNVPAVFPVTAKSRISVVSSDKGIAYYKNGKLVMRNTGQVKLTIKAEKSDNYKAASKTIKVTIVPPQPVIKKIAVKKVSSLKDDVTIKWSCKGEPDGYVIQYTNNGTFTKKNRIWVRDPDTVKYKLSALKRQNGRLYRICAYVKIGKKYYYGRWGEAVSAS